MSGKIKTEKDLFAEVSSALDEVEKLMKSWDGMEKDGEEAGEPAPEEDQIADQPVEDPAAAPEGMEGEGDAPAPAPEGEGEEGMDDHAAMEQHAAELPDEELQMMLEILQAEAEKRQAAQGGSEAPAAAPGAPADLERSMKQEMKELAKSFKSQIEVLTKSVNSLKAENVALKKKAALPTKRPADANSVKTMDKSPKEPSRLSKSETVDYLLGQMRNGNKTVNSAMVADANGAYTDEALAEVHQKLEMAGIKLPNK